VAEEIFLNQMSTGAGSDIESATDLARRMVCEYGMSRLGPLTFGKKEEQIFLGREIAQHRDFSEETARQIDLEVRRLIDEAYQSAHSIVESHADAMHRIAAALLERETIDAEEVKMLIEGKELPPLRSFWPRPPTRAARTCSRCSSRRAAADRSYPEGSPSPAYMFHLCRASSAGAQRLQPGHPYRASSRIPRQSRSPCLENPLLLKPQS
jgi:cell division protease FtsH